MARDPDVETFLDFSQRHMNVNALEPDWESDFRESVTAVRVPEIKDSFRRGFAKSLLGQLTPREYEYFTDWNFDTEAEFHEHLVKYWRMFYGDDDPVASLGPSDDPPKS